MREREDERLKYMRKAVRKEERTRVMNVAHYVF